MEDPAPKLPIRHLHLHPNASPERKVFQNGLLITFFGFGCLFVSACGTAPAPVDQALFSIGCLVVIGASSPLWFTPANSLVGLLVKGHPQKRMFAGLMTVMQSLGLLFGPLYFVTMYSQTVASSTLGEHSGMATAYGIVLVLLVADFVLIKQASPALQWTWKARVSK